MVVETCTEKRGARGATVGARKCLNVRAPCKAGGMCLARSKDERQLCTCGRSRSRTRTGDRQRFNSSPRNHGRRELIGWLRDLSGCGSIDRKPLACGTLPVPSPCCRKGGRRR